MERCVGCGRTVGHEPGNCPPGGVGCAEWVHEHGVDKVGIVSRAQGKVKGTRCRFCGGYYAGDHVCRASGNDDPDRCFKSPTPIESETVKPFKSWLGEAEARREGLYAWLYDNVPYLGAADAGWVADTLLANPDVVLRALGLEPFGWECTEAGDRTIWNDLDKWHAIELNDGEDDGMWHRIYREKAI